MTSTSKDDAYLPNIQDPNSESNDELLLKAPGWIDDDWEYLGPPSQMFNNHALPTQGEDESDDELLLNASGWIDDKLELSRTTELDV